MKKQQFKTMAQAMKEYRSALLMTQATMAQVLGVSARSIACYEQGLRYPQWRTIKVFCEKFNIDPLSLPLE